MQDELLHTSHIAMIRPLSLAQHTLYAELLEQGSEALFDPEFPENGSILVRGSRPGAPARHAYYQGYRRRTGDAGQSQRFSRYLGRVDDSTVAARIAQFQQVKAVRAERAITVRALLGAGMPRPDRNAGQIIEALARAGLFRDPAVLIGDAAIQAYGGVLGVRLAKPRKGDCGGRPAVDIVVHDRLRSADISAALSAFAPGFAHEPETPVAYGSAHGARVAVISVDRADSETADLLSYLIEDPVSAVVLYGPGIPVLVPSPERFAVYALIAEKPSDENAAPEGRARSGPDQAADLIDALLFAGRAHALAAAFAAAGTVRQQLLQTLRARIDLLPDATRLSLSAVIRS